MLCVQVSASAQRPHLFRNEADEWVPYYRLGDRDVRADAVLLRNWELEQLPRGNVRAFGQAEARLLERMFNKLCQKKKNNKLDT